VIRRLYSAVDVGEVKIVRTPRDLEADDHFSTVFFQEPANIFAVVEALWHAATNREATHRASSVVETGKSESK